MGGPGTGGEHARPDLTSFGSEPSSGTPGALFLLILAQIYHKDLYKNEISVKTTSELFAMILAHRL